MIFAMDRLCTFICIILIAIIFSVNDFYYPFSPSSSSLSFLFVRADETDPPEYQRAIQELMDMSKRQANFHIDAFPLDPSVNWNPSIAPWHLINREAPEINPSTGAKPVIVMWCGNSYACSYYVMEYTGPRKEDWKRIKPTDSLEMFSAHGGQGRRPLRVGDLRLYQSGDSVRVEFVSGQPYQLSTGELFYSNDNPYDALYILDPASHLSIQHEEGNKAQKNWMAFQYDLEAPYSGSMNLFVYSVIPHRVVFADDQYAKHHPDAPPMPRGDVRTSSLCSTSITGFTTAGETALPMEQVWRWGTPHGGTPAVLVNTKYGKRYLALFHSQGFFSLPYILTYYMGAYLFDAEPPFAITHISPEPIVPEVFYDEQYGWSYKAIDYIVFPMSLIVDEEENTAIVSTGKNDKQGWIFTMKLKEFIDSFVEVQSKVDHSNFEEHAEQFRI